MVVNRERADARRSSLDGETEGRPGAGRTAGLLMSLAAVTLGVAYGLSGTIATGRVADMAYHSALMTLLVATGIVLWTGRTSTNRNLE